MTRRQRSLAVLGAHLLLVLAVAAKLSWDRTTLPRVWVRTVSYDPSDPLRGRYIRLWLDAIDRRTVRADSVQVEFAVEDGQLVVREARGWPGLPLLNPPPGSARGVVISQSVAFFIPENVPDPSQLEAGKALWAEVTVPSRALPRPIQLQVRDEN